MARWAYRRRDPVMLELRRREAALGFEGGLRSAKIARRLGVSRSAVSQWRRRWTVGGAEGLRAVPRRGRPSPAQARLFGRVGRLLASAPRDRGPSGVRWSLRTIGRALEARWGVRYSRAGLWRALRSRGFLWRPPPGDRKGREGAGRTRPRVEGWVHRRQIYPPDPRTVERRSAGRLRARTKGRRGASRVAPR